MSKAERQLANTLIGQWKLDGEAPGFASVDPVVIGKLNGLFSQFEAMKSAAAAYDDYVEKMARLRARVTFVSQSPYKWKTANGADIFNGNQFGATVKFGEKLGVSLRDNA